MFTYLCYMDDEDLYNDVVLREYIAEILAERSNAPRRGMKSRWSIKYKRSIDCSHPKGFSQKNYCKRRRRGGAYRSD